MLEDNKDKTLFNMDIKDLAGLSEPLKRVIDCLDKGISSLMHPLVYKRVERARLLIEQERSDQNAMKLKRARVLGTHGVPKEKFSPSSPNFDGERKTEFHIVPKPGVRAGRLRPTLNPQDYDLHLDAIDPDYDDFIKLFKLGGRYQQHKRVALHWTEMKYKYSDARIRMMASSLNHRSFSFTRIKSDIFQTDLYGSGSMSFAKLREDMLK